MRQLVFFVFSLSFLSPVFASKAMDDVMAMVEAGAPSLGLAILERRQPRYARKPAKWLQWEELRLQILKKQQDWTTLLERTENFPESLPPSLRADLLTRRAEALMAQERYTASRQLLNQLLWQGLGNSEQIREWRRLLMELYLEANRLDEAVIALRRYEQDYGEGDGAERLVRAMVLLRSGRYAGIDALLQQNRSPRARALVRYAQMMNGDRSAFSVQQEARSLAQSPEAKPADQARFYLLASFAASRHGDAEKQAWLLERALGLYFDIQQEALFKADGDSLWQAYQHLGRALGNEAQLLIGDDQGWLTLAQSFDVSQSTKTRAVYALMAVKGASLETRKLAHRALRESLVQLDDGKTVLDVLYRQSSKFLALEDIPPATRQILAQEALGRSDIPLASQLMQGLHNVPDDVEPFSWLLRRARIHILGGREDEGIDGLYQLLAMSPRLSQSRADRFMQVLFDLQSVKRHEEAIALFTALLPRLTDSQQKRELYFWQADSYSGLGDYENAAWLYLKSALLLNPYAFDPWAQTARFQAAEALANAGLVDDARRMYAALLNVAQEKERKRALKQRLQQLLLQ